MTPIARFTIDPEQSQVWIDGSSSVHPIRATATGLTGWYEPDGGGFVEIPVARLRSGNPLVDRETRRRIDARRFPTIAGELTELRDTGDGVLHARGTITFRGIAVEVEGDLVVTLRDGGLTITGEQTFDVRDWGLEPPRFAMLQVHPTVTVRIRAEAIGGT
jgi:polyisoprenoid-binding protein YceI